MAIIDESGFRRGKLYNKVWYKLNGKQRWRRLPKDPNLMNTEDTKFYNDIFKAGAEIHIIAIIANQHIAGAKDGEYCPPQDWYAHLQSSNQLAGSCGWQEPMLLFPDNDFRNYCYKPDLIWCDIVGGKLCGIAFAQPPPRDFVRLALRVWLQLNYHSYKFYRLIKVLQIPMGDSEIYDLENIPKPYQKKAIEYLTKRWGNWDAKMVERRLKGARFIYFCLADFPTPEHKFLSRRTLWTSLSGGKAHIRVDTVGMEEYEYKELKFWCAVKSRDSDTIDINLPQHRLGEFGEHLARHLVKSAKTKNEKYYSDPQILAERKEYKRQWYLDNPDKFAKYNEKFKEHYHSDPQYRKNYIAKKIRQRKERAN